MKINNFIVYIFLFTGMPWQWPSPVLSQWHSKETERQRVDYSGGITGASHLTCYKEEVIIKQDADNMDGLNYLSGEILDFVNKRAMEGTLSAHIDGGVPNLIINIPEISPYYFGYLTYFFMKACGMSGYLSNLPLPGT